MTIVEDLKHDEGWRPWAYQDSLGFWTIGYGFLIDHVKGGQLPQEIGDLWLEHLIAEKAAELDRRLAWWRDQPDDVQRALLNMAYQLGVSGLLEFKGMLSALQEGARTLAAFRALDSRWATQTPSRAKRVAALIRGQ